MKNANDLIEQIKCLKDDISAGWLVAEGYSDSDPMVKQLFKKQAKLNSLERRLVRLQKKGA